MRLAFFFVFLFSLGISISSCSQINSNKRKKIETKSLDTSSIAIIPFDRAGNWPFNNSYKPTTLTDKEILEIDSILNSCISDYNKSLPEQLKNYYSIDTKKYQYKRQYVVAINQKGEKEIWINCFCNSWGGERWKKEILHVSDGGNCYFNLKINLKTRKCFELSVNGYA